MVCVCVCVRAGGGGVVLPVIQTTVAFRDFEELYRRWFSTNDLQTWQFY